MNDSRKISVIIPFFNEEGNVDKVLSEATEVLKSLNSDFEIIAVDDASRDGTNSLLKAAAARVPELKIITHVKNLGQCAAYWSGFGAVRGDVVVMMDGDGQNDFRDVPGMLALLGRYEAVLGQRTRRNDPLQKLIASRIAFFFRRIVLKDNVRDSACALRAFKKDALRGLIPIRGFQRFIPFMFQQTGIAYTTVDVNHRPRVWGRTKYSLLKGYFLSTIADLLFMWWFKRNNILKKTVGREGKACSR